MNMMIKMRKRIALLTSIALFILMLNYGGEPTVVAVAADHGVNSPRIAEDGTVTWDKIQFGHYKQHMRLEKQPIKWRILSVNEDGTDAFVMSDRALDCRRYNDVMEYTTWETCTLRTWLNSEFINEAFTENEQAVIRQTEVVTGNNPDYGTDGGNNTVDRVYILSAEEACNPAYGFDDAFDRSSKTRYIKATDYAWLHGAHINYNDSIYRNCTWCVRTPGVDNTYLPGVAADGFGALYGTGVATLDAFCPVMHINLNSDVVKDAGEIDTSRNVTSSDDGYHNPVVNDGETKWDCIYLGNYIQDAIYDVEPIEWKVLSVNGDDAFIMSDKAIECMEYNEELEITTWEHCTLRTWLNTVFINEAFDANEQAAIKITEVINSDNTENDIGGNNTSDRVYLLSISEASETAYGFGPDKKSWKNNVYITTTDYCVMKELYCSDDYFGACSWFLRSPGFTGYYAAYMKYDFKINDYGTSVNTSGCGICPVMHIDLSSDAWKTSGTTSSRMDNNEQETPTAIPTNAPTQTPDGYSTAVPTTAPAGSSTESPSTGKTGTTTPSTGKSGTTASPSKASTAKPSTGKTGTDSSSTEPTVTYTISDNGTVTTDGTVIKANAYKNNRELKKIIIGKNVKKIGKKAFYGCKNLKTVIIRSTHFTKKNIGKNAFKRIHPKAVVKVPKSKLKTYRSVFKKAGIKGKKQKITA